MMMKWWVWQHHLVSQSHLTKASADFKHAKKRGRRQNFSKKYFASKN